MRQLFINPTTQNIRAGWRIIIFLALFLLVNASLMFTARSILGRLKATGTLWFLLLAIAATSAAYITTKYVTKEKFASLGLRGRFALKDILLGIVLSGAIMALMYLILLSFGLIEYQGLSWWNADTHQLGRFTSSSLWVMLAVLFQFVVVAWWEELAFRGIILQNIAKGLSIKWGVILSTLGFGLIHAGNPNATVLSTVLIMIITLKLVYAYLKSGQLWLPIGLHLGWNFFQASVFGFASSGHASPSLIAQTPVGPDYLSGGAFGAENSILVVPITLASLLVMHLWIKHSRKLPHLKLQDFVITDATFRKTVSNQELGIKTDDV